jgi:hypothetical protein
LYDELIILTLSHSLVASLVLATISVWVFVIYLQYSLTKNFGSRGDIQIYTLPPAITMTVLLLVHLTAAILGTIK